MVLTGACKHVFDEHTAAPETPCSDESVTPGLPTPQSWLVTLSQLMYSHTVTREFLCLFKMKETLRHEGKITACLLLPGDLLPQT